VTFGCDVGSVQFARMWAGWQLDIQLPWVPSPLLHDVQLVVSELVTNSLRADCTGVTVSLSHSHGTVRLGVHDDAPGTPAILTPAVTDSHGRGLLIVTAIADEWGVSRAEPGTGVPGKEVWATLAVPAVVHDDSSDSGQPGRLHHEAPELPLDAVLGDRSARTVTEALVTDLLEQTQRTMRVDTVAILLLDESHEFLVAAAARGIEEEVRQGVRVRTGRGFAGRIAAERKPVILDEVTPHSVVNPLLLRRGIASMLGVPILLNDLLLGVMHVGSLTPRTFNHLDVGMLQRAAGRVAQVVARHRAFVNRAGATALIQSLTPRLPNLPSLDLAARYVPGSQYGVGGDWYDLFELPDGQVGITIGDVMGHGLHAATVMGRIRSALRSYALEYSDPAVVLTKLDRKIQHFEPGHLATVLFGVLDPDTRVLRACSAGHLPPIVIAPSGRSEPLPLPITPPLGVSRDLQRVGGEAQLDHGAILCLYTDGMVERRTSDLDDELNRLQRALSGAAGLGAEGVCAQAMAEMLADREPEDDVSMLAVRIR
jgi:putative methionine-R-sulfoxide reductase with GAF domain